MHHHTYFIETSNHIPIIICFNLLIKFYKIYYHYEKSYSKTIKSNITKEGG